MVCVLVFALEKSDAEDLAPLMAELIANDKMLGSLMLGYDVGKSSDRLIKAIMRFPCTRSNCDLGGFSRTIADGPEALGAFMGQIAELGKLRVNGKVEFSDEAYADLSKVLEQLGRRTKKADAELINVSRGAAEVSAAIVKISDEFPGAKITRIELPKEPIYKGDGTLIANRQMDIEFEIDGVIRKFEIKSWDPKFGLGENGFLIRSLQGIPNKKLNGEPVGQFRNDLIEMILASGKLDVVSGSLLVDTSKVSKRWRFDGRMQAAGHTPESIADEVLKKFTKDKDFARKFFSQMQLVGFEPGKGGKFTTKQVESYTEFINKGELKKLLVTLIETPKMP